MWTPKWKDDHFQNNHALILTCCNERQLSSNNKIVMSLDLLARSIQSTHSKHPIDKNVSVKVRTRKHANSIIYKNADSFHPDKYLLRELWKLKENYRTILMYIIANPSWIFLYNQILFIHHVTGKERRTQSFSAMASQSVFIIRESRDSLL